MGAIVTCPLEVVKTRLQSSSSGFQIHNVQVPKIASPEGNNHGTCKTLMSSQRRRINTVTSRHATQFLAISHYEGMPPPKKSMGLIQCLRHIVQHEGTKALFKGLGPNLVGVAPSRAIYFCAYSQAKSFLNSVIPPDTAIVHILSASCAVPIILGGRDLMACAQTGSGKTAAFLIPIIHKLLAHPVDLEFEGETCQPQVVIVSPTRELTMQIFDEARKFAKGSILKICIAYGGTGTQHQASKLLNGCHILVATPGRLNDFVNRGRVSFGSIRFFVLDEADRMLDMGFLEEMKKMLEHQSMVETGKRQTLMFSATFPEEIQHLAANFLDNYLFLAVGIVGGACADVKQEFYQVARNEKRNKLKELLLQDDDKVLVFVETKRNADFIAVYLSEQSIPTTSIHGDRQQREREIALNDFKYNRMRVLVATAVAARGLDIKGVAHVINFDLPKSIDEYVHRIGRTGRVGNRGKATSFYDADQDSALAPDLVKILQQAGQEVPEWLDTGSYGGGSGSMQSRFGGRDFRKADSFSNGPQPTAAEEEEVW